MSDRRGPGGRVLWLKRGEIGGRRQQIIRAEVCDDRSHERSPGSCRRARPETEQAIGAEFPDLPAAAWRLSRASKAREVYSSTHRVHRDGTRSGHAVGGGLASTSPIGRHTTGNHEGEVGMSSQRVSGTAVQRTIAVLGSAVFFVVAPCMLAGIVPWSITGWQLRPPFLGLELTRGIGAIMILAGVPGLVDAFARFALQGLGTPAPIAPPRNLVVTGLYRYVRNPIYVALVAIILGQAVLMGDWRLIVYGALLWLFFHVVVVVYEEPTLERTFGREYVAFRAAVPRWIPRMTPWRSK